MARVCPECGAKHPGRPAKCPTTGAALSSDTGLVGSTVNGRYHLVRMLGDGGMGAVYKAADQVLRRFVAIKLLHADVLDNGSAVERFVREARAAAAIGHPNIIDILDFGYSDRSPFLVMEYLRGRSLSHAIANDGRFDIRRACRIATHTLAGLAAAHERGILHRDLKPANLMLVARLGDADFVKICDFGFAALVTPKRSIDDDKQALTPARTLVGTPAYAAPERLKGDDRRDPRMDVYSVGVVLYEMLAGARPFDAPTFAQLARRVRKKPAPPIRAVRPDVPEELEYVLLKALAKKREQRFDDAEAFASALVPFGGQEIERLEEDQPSDSFTMDLIKIQARASQRLKALKAEEADSILERARLGSEPTQFDRGEDDPDDPSQQTLVSSPRAKKKKSGESAPPDWNEHTTPSLPPDFFPGDAAQDSDGIAEASRPVRPSPVGTNPVRTNPVRTNPVRRSAPPPPPPAALRSAVHQVARPTSSAPAYSGRVVVPTLRFIAQRFGERALKRVLSSLPDSDAAVFRAGVDSGSWMDAQTYARFVHAVDQQLGEDNLHLVVECGRAGAEELVAALQSEQRMPTELFIAELPTFAEQWMHGSSIEVRRVGKGYGRIEVMAAKDHHLVTCVNTLGIVDQSLAALGARDAEVNLLTCRALGDHQCLIDISWL